MGIKLSCKICILCSLCSLVQVSSVNAISGSISPTSVVASRPVPRQMPMVGMQRVPGAGMAPFKSYHIKLMYINMFCILSYHC